MLVYDIYISVYILGYIKLILCFTVYVSVLVYVNLILYINYIEFCDEFSAQGRSTAVPTHGASRRVIPPYGTRSRGHEVSRNG